MIEVSASAFDILWQDLDFRCPPPPPLSVPGVGATARERDEIRETVYANLAARGLAAGGRPDPVLRERLTELAEARMYVECEALPALGDETPLRAVAAIAGKRGVLAAQPSRTIGLSSLRDGEVFSSIVGLLAPWEPGPGFGISLPAEVLGASLADPVFSAGAGAGSAACERQLREVLAIQARPVSGAGQFSVRVREGSRLRRVGGVSWFRTDVGTYFGTVEPGRGGRDWVSLLPADAARVAGRLAEFAADPRP
ncbi:ESX secretion-associated protein EspG [Amycolatopsis cynarae]|uniref:ESX secretion-associated protein EspG n=1 Tax=Amycolatopsis cynarae TaxID=2995223 RepID=A0ABY7AUM6_9PSEU|nr:ESX secretion-associated protein EspG [Amycolatopsis sp. HUAS 11-8]WAL63670.1 ESX secretion-associated protein EspG [Amycolatopsis sp. HUAS 11-8]